MDTHFENIESDLAMIARLKKKISGTIEYNGAKIKAILFKTESRFKMNINETIDLDNNDGDFKFFSAKHKLVANLSFTAHKNTINVASKWYSRYTEAKVFSFKTASFLKGDSCYCRSLLYFEDIRMLYNFFGAKLFLSLTVNGQPIVVSHEDKYIVIESVNTIEPKMFSEICYNTLVGIGFISGNFIQNGVFTFQYADREKTKFIGYKYNNLRPNYFSMYHALTENAYSYEHLLGEDFVKDLYNSKALKHFDNKSLSCLIELIYNNKQIQYALVLFNEANSNGLSLLIKNNCFYAILEVLKKFFYDVFKDKLPKGYTNLGNIDKYRVLFSNLFPLTDEECVTIEKRNVYLHGDIKNIEDQEMTDLMHKQITLIYRIITTYVKFDGHIIDHYHIRNNMNTKAFIKINESTLPAC